MAMKQANPWSVKGIETNTRETAKEAARRAGMTVGQWLNTVIQQSADELGEARERAREAATLSPDLRETALDGQIENLEARLAEMAQHLRSVQTLGSLHRPIEHTRAPSGMAHFADHAQDHRSFGSSPQMPLHPAANQLESDVMEMAGAIRNLNQRMDTSEDESREKWSHLESHLGGLDSKLDRLIAGNNPAPLEEAVDSMEAEDLPASAPDFETQRVMLEQIEAMRQRLDGYDLNAPANSEPSVDNTGNIPPTLTTTLSKLVDRLDMLQERISEPRAPIEDALLSTIDKKLARMEDGVQSISKTFDTNKLADQIASKQADAVTSAAREQGAALARASTSGFMDLQQAISDISKRQQNLETAVSANRPIDFDLRFDTLARKLDDALSVRNPDVSAINEHLAILTEIVKDAAHAPKPEFDSIQKRFTDLEARVEHALSVQSQPNQELNVSLRDLTRKLSEPDPAIDELQARLKEVSAKIEQGMAASAPNVDNLNRQLGLIIEQIEFTGKGQDRTGAEMSQLSARLDVIAERIDASLEQARQPDHQLAALEAKLSAIGDRIEDSLSRPATPAADTDSIEAKLNEIGARIESNLAQPVVASVDTSGIEAQLNRLHERMEQTPVAAQNDIEGRLEVLSDQIKRSLSAGQYGTPDLAPLETKLDTLAERIDTKLQTPNAEAPDTSALEERLGRMIADIHVSLERNRPDTNAIESRIASLIDHLERPAPSQDNEDLRTINHQLQSLTTKLETMSGQPQMAASGDPERLSGLENRIADIGNRLDETHSGVRNLQTIESGLKDLFSRLESSQSAAVDAAREAAKAAVIEAGAADGVHAGSVFNALQEKIAEIHDHADQNDRRTRDTLSAVHETLEQVVTRMRALETNSTVASTSDHHPIMSERAAAVESPLHANFAPASMEPASEMPVPEPTTKAAKPKRRFALPGLNGKKSEVHQEAAEVSNPIPIDAPAVADLPPLRPSAPETYADDFAAEPARPPVAPRARMVSSALRADQNAAEPEAGHDPKTDFIAAARRAAQMAARNMDVQEQRDQKKTESEKSWKARFAKIRKPMTYTALGLLMVIGCVQVYRMVAPSSDPVVTNSIPAPAMSVPTADLTRDSVPEETNAIDPAMNGVLPPLTDAEEADFGPAEIGTPLTENGEIDDSPVRVIGLTQSPGAGNPPLEIDGFDQPQIPVETASISASDTESAASESKPTDIEALLATLPTDQFPEALRQAAVNGNPVAQFEVAARFAEGSKLQADLFRASEWYARAAGQGLAPAQYRLGSLYEKGQGVEADASIAKIWYERSALQGNRKAMHNLAVLLAGDKLGEPDFPAAARWFQEAAQLDLADSQFNLAILRARGFGTEQNPAEAYKWFALAADNGDKMAAERRDMIAKQLDEDTLVASKLSVQSWSPQDLDVAANTVAMPEGGWGEVTARVDDPAARAATLIKQTQMLLNARGFDVGTPDGVIGPQTASAIKAFERAQGLPESGAITPKLIQALTSSTG